MSGLARQLGEYLKSSNNVVFFGGAGVSTESGIPDFRSATGLYSTSTGTSYPPEYMLSHSCFLDRPRDFFDFYRKNMLYPDAQPNACHLALAELEQLGKLRAVVTQNIDGLHQAAGSTNVLELHGSVHRNYCMECFQSHPMRTIIDNDFPICECGGVIKPDVVLYEEGLDEDTINDSVEAISQADILIVGGTSLNVYPAAGLVRYYRGKRLILINKSETPMDHVAHLVVREPLGEVFTLAMDVVRS